jgi:ZIP family zinc transporter
VQNIHLLDILKKASFFRIIILRAINLDWVTVAAIFLSNIPEGLSSAACMKKAGRSIGYIFGVWSAISVISGISALLGYTLFSHFSAEVIAATTAVAAGGILATISDTMMPEALEETHDFAGLITVCGFLAAFVLSKLAER